LQRASKISKTTTVVLVSCIGTKLAPLGSNSKLITLFVLRQSPFWFCGQCPCTEPATSSASPSSPAGSR
jgi:hypothetical protein